MENKQKLEKAEKSDKSDKKVIKRSINWEQDEKVIRNIYIS